MVSEVNKVSRLAVGPALRATSTSSRISNTRLGLLHTDSANHTRTMLLQPAVHLYIESCCGLGDTDG